MTFEIHDKRFNFVSILRSKFRTLTKKDLLRVTFLNEMIKERWVTRENKGKSVQKHIILRFAKQLNRRANVEWRFKCIKPIGYLILVLCVYFFVCSTLSENITRIKELLQCFWCSELLLPFLCGCQVEDCKLKKWWFKFSSVW